MLFPGTDLKTPCYDVYCFASEEELKNFKGSLGDIAVVGSTTYAFDITTHAWVKITYSSTEAPKNEATKTINECPTCGAHRFIRKDNHHYQCEYCDNIYEV